MQLDNQKSHFEGRLKEQKEELIGETNLYFYIFLPNLIIDRPFTIINRLPIQ